MSTLLDECMPLALAAALRSVGVDVHHLFEFPELLHLKNGRLATALKDLPKFESFITEDKNFVAQSGIFSKRSDIAVLRVQSVTLRRTADQVYVPRFIAAVAKEGLPFVAGKEILWPTGNFNVESSV